MNNNIKTTTIEGDNKIARVYLMRFKVASYYNYSVCYEVSRERELIESGIMPMESKEEAEENYMQIVYSYINEIGK